MSPHRLRVFASISRICLLLAAMVILNGCQTVFEESSIQPRFRRVTTPGAEIGASKTFVLDGDWNFGQVTMRRGSSITFSPEGRGAFSGVVFTDYSEGGRIRFASAQYRRDGNVLFIFPYGEVAYLNIPHPRQDYPYDMTFGFDRRHYEHISWVKFAGSAELTPLEPSVRRKP